MKILAMSVLSVWLIACSGCQTIKEEVSKIADCEGDNCSTKVDPILTPDPIEKPENETCESPDCLEHETPIESDPQQNLNDTQKEFLDAHNDWRKSVGINPLRYSFDLEKEAQEWSKTLIENYFCKIMHNPLRSGGENLYWHSNYKMVTPTDAVDAWGSELKDYDYNTNTCANGKVCGHYTQLVWADTNEVGCAVRRCDAGKQVVVVCNYNPAGNWVGEKPY